MKNGGISKIAAKSGGGGGLSAQQAVRIVADVRFEPY